MGGLEDGPCLVKAFPLAMPFPKAIPKGSQGREHRSEGRKDIGRKLCVALVVLAYAVEKRRLYVRDHCAEEVVEKCALNDLLCKSVVTGIGQSLQSSCPEKVGHDHLVGLLVQFC